MSRQGFPLISVVTPSFNQGQYISETIDSVLNQDYPHIEHLVIDGGSTDGTVSILQDYSNRDPRFRFVSEPDRGQSHALNKGFRLAQGSIIGWLNSDDTYRPGAISRAVDALQRHSEWALVYGKAYYINEYSQTINFYPVEPYSDDMLFRVNTICQPAAFFRKTALDSLGGVDGDLYFCMDYDLWIRMSKRYPIGYIGDVLANARLHPDCKNVRDWLDIGYPEVFQVSNRHYGKISDYWLMEYIGNHVALGGAWIMHQLKRYGISGPSPQITETNRYDDAWVPSRFRCVIHSDPGNPLHMVAIKGRHRMAEFFPDCGSLIFSVRINGAAVLDHCVKGGLFNLEIPVENGNTEYVIEIESEQAFVPADYGDSEDTRSLSFVMEEIFPLSCREYDYYALLQKLE